MRTIHLSLVAVLSTTAAAQSTDVATAVKATTAVRISGPSATNLAVTKVSVPATAVESAPLISGIQLLAIDVAGRTPLTDLSGPDAHVVNPSGSAQAVELPGPGAIRIFHYVKPASHHFGFFAARGNGDVAVLLERVGLGANQTVDPFDAVIGAALDGSTIAIAASKPKQGVQGLGDAWLLRVDGGNLASGQPIRELTGGSDIDVNGVGQTFFGTMLYATSHSGLLRAPSDGSGTYAIVALPPSAGGTPSELFSELARSRDGSTLALIAGPSETAVDIYRVDLNGSIVNATSSPAAVRAPGYLPETSDGPHFALSDDGSTVFYEVAFANGDELFMRALAPGAVPIQLTQDAEFDTSIDQMSGILTGGSFARFLAASGQHNADLYRTTLPSFGTPALSNLTKSSGAAAPWFPNTATIQVANQWNVHGARLIADDQTAAGQGFALWSSSTADVAGIALSSLSAPPKVFAPAVAAQRVVIAAVSGTQAHLLAFDGAGAPQSLMTLPPGVAISSVAVRDGGFVTGFAAEAGALGSFVVQVSAAGGGFQIVPGSPFVDARDLLYGRGGSLMFAAGGAGGLTETFVLRSAVAPVVKAGAPATIAFWLR